MSPELDRLCSLLRSVAETEIMPRFHNAEAQAKADGSLVTVADLAVQRRICEELGRLRPGLPVLGEEMTQEAQEQLLTDADTGVWCLDPLDGTSNYAYGFPYFCISLALLRGGEPVLGCIVDPVHDECFCAERGVGAFHNGAPLRLASQRTELRKSLAIVDLKRLPNEDLPSMGGQSPFCSQRNLGSIALDWCWLAAGRIQLYIHGGQKLWDYAAGRLIATEAGAVSRLYIRSGGPPVDGLSLAPRMAIAAENQILFEHLLAWWSGLPHGSG
ncbi:MAG: inositol monophosphatase family protein [Candidatus Thiosymbion ectosymbiont of Robbea hypermnestra]|nr:inositol monophosphatase family protein [Candidatus Thiosymbion ectosymbiont of Robbea hypermnestra]